MSNDVKQNGAMVGAKNDDVITQDWLRELLDKDTQSVMKAAEKLHKNTRQHSEDNHTKTREQIDAAREEMNAAIAGANQTIVDGFTGTAKNLDGLAKTVNDNNRILRKMEEDDQPKFGAREVFGIAAGALLAIFTMKVVPIDILGPGWTGLLMFASFVLGLAFIFIIAGPAELLYTRAKGSVQERRARKLDDSDEEKPEQKQGDADDAGKKKS